MKLVTTLVLTLALSGIMGCDDKSQEAPAQVEPTTAATTNPNPGIQPASSDSHQMMEDAYEECGADYPKEQFSFAVDDNLGLTGTFIIGFVEGGPGEQEIFCVLDALEAPDEVLNSFTSSELNNGTEVWDNFEFSWTHDPSQPGSGWQALFLVGVQ